MITEKTDSVSQYFVIPDPRTPGDISCNSTFIIWMHSGTSGVI